MNPELKAMSDVFDALKGLDTDTRKRVAEWVLARLRNAEEAPAAPKGTKRGRKPGAKKAGSKRSPIADVTEAIAESTPKKRGPKAGSKKAGAKRGPKPGAKRGRKPAAVKSTATVAKKTGKRGRPAGTGKKAVKKAAAKSTVGRRGRPRKSAGAVA